MVARNDGTSVAFLRNSQETVPYILIYNAVELKKLGVEMTAAFTHFISADGIHQ